MMQRALGRSNLVLLGVGHTNAHLVRMWKMHPIDNADLVCISNYPIATYSGMLPGVLSGQYPPSAMEIDLVRLCRSANCRLIIDDVTEIDRDARQIQFAGRAPEPYDAVSIGIGSRPTFAGVDIAPDAPVEAIKPMPTLLERLRRRFSELQSKPGLDLRIAVVGAGVGGIEISFCLLTRLQKQLPQRHSVVSLISGSGELDAGLARWTRRHVRRSLAERGVQLIEGKRVAAVNRDHLVFDDQSTLPVDLVLWATGAIAPELLQAIDVAKDDRGFLLIRPTLQTVTDPAIFAVGDTGSLEINTTPKAGVFAVRQGPVLWHNVRRYLSSRSLHDYQPQRNFLKLINTGDGRAVGEYFGFANHSMLMWKIKDSIDSKFMKKYQRYDPMSPPLLSENSDQSTRCVGCGGKIGSHSLTEALRQLKQPAAEQVVVGLDAPDDAAVVRLNENQVTATVDFFAAPLDDPYWMGVVAAHHAASDLYACGAKPTAALASFEIPFGHPRGQQRFLSLLLQGAIDALQDVPVVGGHTIEGPRLAAGFTMLGDLIDQPVRKSGLRAGDVLIVTKAVGTGVLLAANMSARCPADWFMSLMQSLKSSNRVALDLVEQFKIHAMTDVTGFGLAGHLLEMLDASQLSARLQLDSVPTLPGSEQLVNSGWESTLAPDNKSNEVRIDVATQLADTARYSLLFDPQTNGGLLLGVEPTQAESVIEFLLAAGYPCSAVIGQIFSGHSISDPILKIE